MRYLNAQDAACLCASCPFMKGVLVDFGFGQMHLMWWLLGEVQAICWRYDIVIARRPAVLGRYVELELEYVADLRRLFREYQQVVQRIPIHVADTMRDVHDCGMVFQVLSDYDEEDLPRWQRLFSLSCVG